MDIASSQKWNELTGKIGFISETNYQKTLALFYEEFGERMLNDELLGRFISTYQNKNIALYYTKVKEDFYQIKLNIIIQEFRSKISTINNKKSYQDLLKLLYFKMESETYNKKLIQKLIYKIVEIYELDSKFCNSSTDVERDFIIIRLKEEIGTITDIESYKHTLGLYYNVCEDEAFEKEMIQKFMDAYELEIQFHICFSDIWNDLAKMYFEDEIGVITDRKSYLESLELYYNEFEEDVLFDEEILSKFVSTYHLDARFKISQNDVWNDLAKIKRRSKLEDKIIEKFEAIEDEETYKEALELYYNVFGEDMFELDKVQRFIDTFNLEEIDITPNTVYRDLRAIKRAFETGNIVSSKKTEPVQTQSKQIQTINNNVPRKPETLDEYMLIDIVRNMPIWLNSESSNISENRSIIDMCTRLANKAVSEIMTNETLMQFENTIHQKRLKAPNKTEYDKRMENNIFYELYCYSYLTNVFEAVPRNLNGTLNVDFKKYISLVENECRERVQNLDNEKRKIQDIRVILETYAQSSAQYKMPSLGVINQRENDYIIACLMHRGIIPCIAPLFYDSKEQWKIFNSISGKEFAQTLDIYLSQTISMHLSIYAGDKIFK